MFLECKTPSLHKTLLSCTWYATHPKNATDHTRLDKREIFLTEKLKKPNKTLVQYVTEFGEYWAACHCLYNIDNTVVSVKDHRLQNQYDTQVGYCRFLMCKTRLHEYLRLWSTLQLAFWCSYLLPRLITCNTYTDHEA